MAVAVYTDVNVQLSKFTSLPLSELVHYRKYFRLIFWNEKEWENLILAILQYFDF